MNKHTPFIWITLTLSWWQFSCGSETVLPVNTSGINLPPGFKLEVFADSVPNARGMAWGDNGTLFVGSRGAGNVYAVVDENNDFKADKVYTLAEGINMPAGVAFKDGDLYFSGVSTIYKIADVEANLSNPPAPTVVTAAFPTDESHGWKYIAFGPDGKLYVPVGAPCNICNEEEEIYGTITRINADGTGLEIVASGIRNTVGFDWQPGTGHLWFTDNGRDWMGDDLPPCELNHITQPNMHFGYPFCHGTDIKDPDFGDLRSCDEFTPPAQELGPHVAPLGMKFYTGTMFPPQYRGQVFIAEHGSWNRSTKIGYRIMLVTIENGVGTSYETFASGWEKDGEVMGRPVDILLMKDGSMLVSDDHAGKIYRISYSR